jgi:uncharacterized protein (DUF1800 family)
MRAFIPGFAFIALTAIPASAQMAPPPQPQMQSEDQAPSKTMAPSQEDQPAMAPTHKTTAPIRLPQSKIDPNLPLSPRERAVQMLNRFTFGPRPGDIERVLAMGPDAWFAQQLNPTSINDDALAKRLEDYPTLNLSPEQAFTLFAGFRAQISAGNLPYPADPLLASLYEVMAYRSVEIKGASDLFIKKQHYEKKETDDVLAARAKLKAELDAQAAAQKKVDQATASRVAGELLALPKDQRMTALEAMPPLDRFNFAYYCPQDQRTILFADFTPRERIVLRVMSGGANMYDDIAQAKVLRTILSERQLQEVMTDFWFNHFNIFQPNESDELFTTSYERDAIRANALGKFRDLLLATAQSPAMMVYLDNYTSIGPNSIANGADPANPNAKKGNRGLNENYGREVMELHTVGVNGGYTQDDVTHLAAILTGWTVDRPGQAGPFVFNIKQHEPGTKQWFGYTIDDQGKVLAGPAGQPLPVIQFPTNVPDGMKQGYAALTILANSPKTAHFISWLLAQRFIADDPPPALVDRMAATFRSSDGDIKAVLKTLVSSPEFNSHRYFRNKVKTPTEFVASAFRATATDPQNPNALVALLGHELGQPLFKMLTPNGYYITADQWMNTSSLLARLNFADQLTHSRIGNQKFDSLRLLGIVSGSSIGPAAASAQFAGKPHAMTVSTAGPTSSIDLTTALNVLEATLIAGEVSPGTDQFIHSQMNAQAANNPIEALNLLTALLIGSPEFQQR